MPITRRTFLRGLAANTIVLSLPVSKGSDNQLFDQRVIDDASGYSCERMRHEKYQYSNSTIHVCTDSRVWYSLPVRLPNRMNHIFTFKPISFEYTKGS